MQRLISPEICLHIMYNYVYTHIILYVILKMDSLIKNTLSILCVPNSLLIGSPAFTCCHLLYHVIFHVVIVFCLCTYSVNLCCIGVQ